MILPLHWQWLLLLPQLVFRKAILRSVLLCEPQMREMLLKWHSTFARKGVIVRFATICKLKQSLCSDL